RKTRDADEADEDSDAEQKKKEQKRQEEPEPTMEVMQTESETLEQKVDRLSRQVDRMHVGRVGFHEDVLGFILASIPHSINELELMEHQVRKEVTKMVPSEILVSLPPVVKQDVSGLDTWLSRDERS